MGNPNFPLGESDDEALSRANIEAGAPLKRALAEIDLGRMAALLAAEQALRKSEQAGNHVATDEIADKLKRDGHYK